MPPRANWKGYLRLSLVSCPIALYPASSLSEKVSFNRINRKTGNRSYCPQCSLSGPLYLMVNDTRVRTCQSIFQAINQGFSAEGLA